MALFNHAKREINAKIVYYGHEGAGKRASLQYIYDRIRPALRGELKKLATGGDSLLFFDFSPFEKPVFGGYRLRFHMYSLTGKVSNPAAWKMTLKGADGLVVVADASAEGLPAARESVLLLREFLAGYGVGLGDIPTVVQLNRTGAGQMPSANMTAADLDLPGVPVCHSASAGGEGVLEALSLLSREVVAHIGRSDALRGTGQEEAGGSSGDADAPDVQHPPAPLEALKQQEPAARCGGRTAMSLSAAGGDAGALHVAVAAEGLENGNGVVRLPLDITVAGAKHRLVISIALENLQPVTPSG